MLSSRSSARAEIGTNGDSGDWLDLVGGDEEKRSIFGFTFANRWGVDSLARQSVCSYVLLPMAVLEGDVKVG
jgi:hypothetical protein